MNQKYNINTLTTLMDIIYDNSQHIIENEYIQICNLLTDVKKRIFDLNVSDLEREIIVLKQSLNNVESTFEEYQSRISIEHTHLERYMHELEKKLLKNDIAKNELLKKYEDLETQNKIIGKDNEILYKENECLKKECNSFSEKYQQLERYKRIYNNTRTPRSISNWGWRT